MKRTKKHYAGLRSKNKKINCKPKFILKRNVKFEQPDHKQPKPIVVDKNDKIRVQICGLFNSGTNLMVNVIENVFNVHIGKEGHLDFWKHTVLSKQFAQKHVKKNTLYILVTKNPYFQFHSFKKQLYSIQTNNTSDVNVFVKQCLSIKPPRYVVTDMSTVEFKNFPHYWNSFYRNALKFIPNIIVVKYEDLLFNPISVIDTLKKYMPIKNINVDDTIEQIINTPSKQSGKPRFGDSAKTYYDPNNIQTLFTHDTFQWINTNLDCDVMKALNYSFN